MFCSKLVMKEAGRWWRIWQSWSVLFSGPIDPKAEVESAVNAEYQGWDGFSGVLYALSSFFFFPLFWFPFNLFFVINSFCFDLVPTPTRSYGCRYRNHTRWLYVFTWQVQLVIIEFLLVIQIFKYIWVLIRSISESCIIKIINLPVFDDTSERGTMDAQVGQKLKWFNEQHAMSRA